MSDRNKILMISSGGLEGFSGVNENLYNALSKKYQIDVFDNKLVGFWKYYNSLYCLLKSPGKKKFIHPIKAIYSGNVSYYRFRTKYYYMKRTKKAEIFLNDKANDYDLILQTGWVPAILTKSKVSRCIFTDYTMKLAEKEFEPWSKFLKQEDKKKWIEIEKISYRNANFVYTASEHTRQSIIKDYGVDEDKVITVYEGINFTNFSVTEKKYENVILFIGIDFERKGGYVLLDAFKKVRDNIRDVKLIILGSNPEINEEGVEIKGFVSQEEKLHYYTISSIFVMPSIAEPFGLVFLEAMASKVPCIGTNIDAMPEIIKNGETGYIVEPNNPDELAERMIFLLKNKSTVEEMGIEGRKRVEELFTWNKVLERMNL